LSPTKRTIGEVMRSLIACNASFFTNPRFPNRRLLGLKPGLGEKGAAKCLFCFLLVFILIVQSYEFFLK